MKTEECNSYRSIVIDKNFQFETEVLSRKEEIKKIVDSEDFDSQRIHDLCYEVECINKQKMDHKETDKSTMLKIYKL